MTHVCGYHRQLRILHSTWQRGNYTSQQFVRDGFTYAAEFTILSEGRFPYSLPLRQPHRKNSATDILGKWDGQLNVTIARNWQHAALLHSLPHFLFFLLLLFQRPLQTQFPLDPTNAASLLDSCEHYTQHSEYWRCWLRLRPAWQRPACRCPTWQRPASSTMASLKARNMFLLGNSALNFDGSGVGRRSKHDIFQSRYQLRGILSPP